MIWSKGLSEVLWNMLCAIMSLVVMQVQAQTLSPSPETTITVTAPLNPVREGDMLSIMCKITNLEREDSVILRRTVNGETEKISLDQTIQGSLDNRFFLANRRLSSGAMVYFLSVIDVTRDGDEGEYECRVIQEDKIMTKKINAKVQYFPSERSTQCSSDFLATAVVVSGTRISFNCSSEDGLPEVDIAWAVTTTTGEELRYTHTRADGMVHSKLSLEASMRYNDAVFICKITSAGFETERTCHVGPLTITRNPLNPDEPDYYPPPPNTDPGRGSNQAGPDVDIYDDTDSNPGSNPGIIRRPGDSDVTTTDCSAICASQQSTSTFYWIIATVVAAILAILFLLIGICIATKLCNMQKSRSSQYSTVPHIGQIIQYRQPQLEDVYERIECGGGNRDDERMYMALHGLRKPDNLVVQTDMPVEIEDNYTRTPTAPIQHGGTPVMMGAVLLPSSEGGTYIRTASAFTAGMQDGYARTQTAITSDAVEVASEAVQ